jgi:hypothetical protein
MPQAESAVVEREKVVEYLLSQTHRYGAAKARFFGAFGFRRQQWERLALALREHCREYDVARVHETGFGPRYEVEGRLRAPDGRSPLVRTVWQHDRGAEAPRLITAYPLEERP